MWIFFKSSLRILSSVDIALSFLVLLSGEFSMSSHTRCIVAVSRTLLRPECVSRLADFLLRFSIVPCLSNYFSQTYILWLHGAFFLWKSCKNWVWISEIFSPRSLLCTYQVLFLRLHCLSAVSIWLLSVTSPKKNGLAFILSIYFKT